MLNSVQFPIDINTAQGVRVIVVIVEGSFQG